MSKFKLTPSQKASMEPRPHERGKFISSIKLRSIINSFNGATSSRTWKGVSVEPEATKVCGQLQWSHVLTNVESPRNQRAIVGGVGASMEPRPHERGKYRLLVRAFSAAGASMEPRPHERGKDSNTKKLPHRPSCFNGATSSRTWKDCESLSRHSMAIRFNGATSSRTWKVAACWHQACGQTCFNGATSSRTWKETACRRAVSAARRLQWSHVLTNVESIAQYVLAIPVHWRFNGATSSRTWKGAMDVCVTAIPYASMEPRPHERGKLTLRCPKCAATTGLQWSHVLTNVESNLRLCTATQNNQLQWSHVLTNVESDRQREEEEAYEYASMEPRPHERGKRRLPVTERARSRASMEPRPHERGKQRCGAQSWRGCEGGFNGATSSRTWKEPSSEHETQPANASMEPRPHERGKWRA